MKKQVEKQEEKVELTDGVRLQAVLDELHINASFMAKELGYKSHSMFYQILNGQYSIGSELAKKIIERWPEVSYLYLMLGEEPVILDRENERNQDRLMPGGGLNDLLSIPRHLARIVELLEKIESKL